MHRQYNNALESNYNMFNPYKLDLWQKFKITYNSSVIVITCCVSPSNHAYHSFVVEIHNDMWMTIVNFLNIKSRKSNQYICFQETFKIVYVLEIYVMYHFLNWESYTLFNRNFTTANHTLTQYLMPSCLQMIGATTSS